LFTASPLVLPRVDRSAHDVSFADPSSQKLKPGRRAPPRAPHPAAPCFPGLSTHTHKYHTKHLHRSHTARLWISGGRGLERSRLMPFAGRAEGGGSAAPLPAVEDESKRSSGRRGPQGDAQTRWSPDLPSPACRSSFPVTETGPDPGIDGSLPDCLTIERWRGLEDGNLQRPRPWFLSAALDEGVWRLRRRRAPTTGTRSARATSQSWYAAKRRTKIPLPPSLLTGEPLDRDTEPAKPEDTHVTDRVNK
jgi:hypothetical protein